MDREEDSSGTASCHYPPAPALFKQRQNRVESVFFRAEPCTADGTGSSEPTEHPNHDEITCPTAMRESGQQPIAESEGSKQQLSEFYFNLGRSMMLDSILG